MEKKGFSTLTSHLGRNRTYTGNLVNTPPYRGSTVLFPSVEAMDEAHERVMEGEEVLTYGTNGAHSQRAFAEMMNALEGGAGTWFYSTGLAGCVIPFFAFAKAGDHVLVTDSVYGPTRDFCEKILSGLGVDVEFYDPLIGAGIEALIKENTVLIFLESPGTHSFEMQDIPAIVEVAKKHKVWTMIDNSWATPVFFRPLEVGVDVVIHAVTKYIAGHSDVLMASATCNEAAWPLVRDVSYTMGQLSSADDIYLAMRGLRSLKVRMNAVQESAKKVVAWLKARPEVEKILWPADPEDPGYEIWKRDFSGAAGLFGLKFKDEIAPEAVRKFLNSLKLFGLGYSWGGFESLAIPSYGKRTERGTDFTRMVRISVGLEETADLIADLEQALEKMK